jgi:hypothetical protein
MGHRANYVIKTADQVEVYYSHWGANVIEQDLFWGPEHALDFIRTQRKMGSWLDDVWCEGGATLDVPNQTLTFFGGEDIQHDPFLREHLLTLFKASWTPWRVEWAHRGIFDLAKVAGVEESEVYSKGSDRSCFKKLRLPELGSKKRRRCDGLLNFNGKRFTIVDHLTTYLPMGPKFAKALPNKQAPLFLEECPPRSGATVLEVERKIQFWALSAHPLLEEWIRLAWPGWHVERYEEYAVHQVTEFMVRVGQQPPSLSESLATFRKQFLRDVKSRALDLDTCKKIHGEEAEIELNPLATEDVRPSNEALDKAAIFDAVVEKLHGLQDPASPTV